MTLGDPRGSSLASTFAKLFLLESGLSGSVTDKRLKAAHG